MISKFIAAISTILLFAACGQVDTNEFNTASDSLTEEQRHVAANALKSLTIADGLEAKLMVAEPVLRDPTNIDVDDRGRIWVTEGFNYRPFRNTTTIPEGDRIMILEDNDGDGVAEVGKVFYQGPEIATPLGICVIGNKVIVSQSPYVWAFYDDNGDDKADRKEIIFQGISGIQHDHGMHAFTSGPDGKLYFNFGNAGVSFRDKNNKVVLDQFGDSIGSPKYKQGQIFRCDPDGSHVERMANNFRNNYEVTTDSYGAMWQSDNDDDGNRGVRINYVMDYGNYGYTDEMTGASWSAYRTNMEDSIPYRHWHLNDPGVVPNLLQTGSGSPTGILVYEGSLLPEKFQNQMIHCEPGQNVVRAYPVKKDGAGYTATIENILTGEKDQWFRPSDVCVAPDGSLIVADWYDPVVGGHAANDKESGRLYRIAPKGSEYKVPKFDYTTTDGVITALQNPNLAVRRKAWIAIQQMGAKVVPALEQMYKDNKNSRMRARAFWALVKLPGGEKYIDEAIKDSDADIRICGLRAARELNHNVIEVVKNLVKDTDIQVRRECAIALHKNKSPEAAALWVELAQQYDGKDRWYLEALGIAAAEQWDRFFDAYVQKVQDPLQSAAGRDIVWRSRTDKSLPYLVKLASDDGNIKSRLRYFRAFDFNRSNAKTQTLLKMIVDNKTNNAEINALILQGLDPKDVKNSMAAKRALTQVVQFAYGKTTYIDLVNKYKLTSESPRLVQLALDKPEEGMATEAIHLVYHFGKQNMLADILKGKDDKKISELLIALSFVGNDQALGMIRDVMLGKNYNDTLKMSAAKMLGRSWDGGTFIMDLLKSSKIPRELIPPALEGLKDGPRKDLAVDIKNLMSEGADKNKVPFDRNAVMEMKGEASKGEAVFKTNCSICHQVKGQGTDFGPKLSEIGSKLPKDGLLDAIIEPSAGISFGYETVELSMKDGSKVRGLLFAKTDKQISLKIPGGSINNVETDKIKTMTVLEESMMPSLKDAMPKEDLANLLSYLSSLKNK